MGQGSSHSLKSDVSKLQKEKGREGFEPDLAMKGRERIYTLTDGERIWESPKQQGRSINVR